ncbi:hypothetical protein MKW94_029931, partial [Papaver nudicaule]|nr:hypothetical protein [Papaver nudicaule]
PNMKYVLCIYRRGHSAHKVDSRSAFYRRGHWSIRLRAFYISCPLFLWIFGPVPMFSCCCILLSVLYFLDTTSSITRELHSHHMKHDDDHELKDNVELVGTSVHDLYITIY